ncbi:hypothetical protein DYB26_004740 [Aphanomyces astaci]|uniref:Methyltransferase type 11 domain-containing protein n=1 Tax=Aphanomyces astaci TaxID=112090 RepID=A0A397APS7_APHAT|nr:hypothetical protein DYB36_001552 [Aphanomyces astaci]RHY73726.1 hypothetical protein DYB34_001351 [Aphanomyces astaci]RHY79766.1 hypothetical protein DYB31_000094 [Aphanomyces astaci]RHZ21832.1 hypothetical protein DYB26_004740 [Aphanomyces astaci]
MTARKAALVFGGLSVYATATLGTYIYMYDPDKGNAKPITGGERQARFDKNSAEYDNGGFACSSIMLRLIVRLPIVEIDWDETMVGIKLMRRFLLRNASGSVLEVAAGTGRNVPYYNQDSNVLLTDLSASMLGQIKHLPSHIRTSVMSAEDLDAPNHSFDTVVDTFALCSVDNPVRMLEEMQRVCKPNGRILLLEHGKSSYSWLTYVLDKFALKHAERWGCFWNRDILKIVADAGLEVESSYRFHFGTTYYIVARPRPLDCRER